MMIGPDVSVAAGSVSTPAAAAPVVAAQAAVAALKPAAPPAPTRNALQAAKLMFELDAETGKPIVRIVDPASGQVIRQMPTEEALEIARDLGRIEGLMIRVKA